MGNPDPELVAQPQMLAESSPIADLTPPATLTPGMVNKIKIAELNNKLSRRNASTHDLKTILVTRLLEALTNNILLVKNMDKEVVYDIADTDFAATEDWKSEDPNKYG